MPFPRIRSLLLFLTHPMSSLESGTGTVSSRTFPCDLHGLYLTSGIVRSDAFQVRITGFDTKHFVDLFLLTLQPTGIFRVVVKDGFVKKCGDFTSIYAGEVLTEAPHDTVPVRL